MFDIGFWELVVVGVVGLLLVGPERLPGVAREAGLWVGRLRRFANNVKGDIRRELELEGQGAQDPLREVREALEEGRGAISGLKDANAAPARPAAQPPAEPAHTPPPSPAPTPPAATPPAAPVGAAAPEAGPAPQSEPERDSDAARAP